MKSPFFPLSNVLGKITVSTFFFGTVERLPPHLARGEAMIQASNLKDVRGAPHSECFQSSKNSTDRG